MVALLLLAAWPARARADSDLAPIDPLDGATPVGHAAASSIAERSADADPNVWTSHGETQGAWLAWTYGSAADRATPISALGMLPGDRTHGRPRDVLVRLIHAVSQENRPDLPAGPEAFATPWLETMVTAHRLTLTDEAVWQYLVLNEPETVLGFQIIVESVYPGDAFDDVAVAGLRFARPADDLKDDHAITHDQATWWPEPSSEPDIAISAGQAPAAPVLALGGLAAISGVFVVSSHMAGGRRRH
jgi:hypothetical protein